MGMGNKIIAVPLTAQSAPPSLSLISPSLTTAATKIGNQGTSTKTTDIAPSTNLYHLAPSGTAGRPCLSASRNKPREVTVGQDVLEMELGWMERHPYTSQAFVPMGSRTEMAYIAIVADGNADNSAPDLKTLKAYLVRGNEGICYAANTWHAPMAVIGEVSPD